MIREARGSVPKTAARRSQTRAPHAGIRREPLRHKGPFRSVARLHSPQLCAKSKLPPPARMEPPGRTNRAAATGTTGAARTHKQGRRDGHDRSRPAVLHPR